MSDGGEFSPRFTSTIAVEIWDAYSAGEIPTSLAKNFAGDSLLITSKNLQGLVDGAIEALRTRPSKSREETRQHVIDVQRLIDVALRSRANVMHLARGIHQRTEAEFTEKLKKPATYSATEIDRLCSSRKSDRDFFEGQVQRFTHAHQVVMEAGFVVWPEPEIYLLLKLE